MREEEMNCKEICELLIAYLDGEVMPEEKAYIEAHQTGCPQCHAELEALSAMQANLRGVLKSMADEVSPSVQAWEKVRAQVEKGNWFDGLHRLLTSKTWQVATVTAAVVVIAVVAAVWQFGGVGQAPPVPAPAPRPSPPPPFQVSVVPEEAHYLPGELVEVKLSLTNVSSAPITLDLYPPEIRVAPRLNWDQVLFSVTGGTKPREIKPNETVSVDFTWDQKDKAGRQVQPGWYNVIFGDITVRQGGSRRTFNPRAHVLIQYPQGAMEKSFDLDQSQTVNGITVTLERVELTAGGSSFYFFFIPPGYTPAPPLAPGVEPPPPSIVARAEYSIDGITKHAGSAGFNTKGDGIKLVWGGGPGKLDRVPSDAQELIFIITQLNDWEGPWEFKIPLE